MSAPMRTVEVGGVAPYRIHIGAGLLADGTLLAQTLRGRHVLVVSDSHVAPLYAQAVEDALHAAHPELRIGRHVLRAGEAEKTLANFGAVIDALAALGATRDACVFALGGGVVGDLAGFAAACWMRGIDCVQLPTTLLAMVDSSVGGKTAVDIPQGKNLVGAFHPPAAVIVDPLAIRSLRSAHVRGGLMEAVKHGLVADAAYYDWIAESTRALLRRDAAAVTRLVETSVTIKADVVGDDEKETGRRAILNAGHTVAHALERWSGYRIPHGDAVGIGLHVETVLAEDLGLAPPGTAALLQRRLTALGLTLTLPPASDDDALLEAMHHDKKVRDHAIRFALPRQPGALAALTGDWTTAVPDDIVRQSLGRVRSLYGA